MRETTLVTISDFNEYKVYILKKIEEFEKEISENAKSLQLLKNEIYILNNNLQNSISKLEVKIAVICGALSFVGSAIFTALFNIILKTMM